MVDHVQACCHMNMAEVETRVKICVSALNPKKKDQGRFWQFVTMDQQRTQFGKEVKETVMNFVNF